VAALSNQSLKSFSFIPDSLYDLIVATVASFGGIQRSEEWGRDKSIFLDQAGRMGMLSPSLVAFP
jgi:hypothetical protein